MVVKKKLKETKLLIAALFLISIIGMVTTVSASGSNRVLFMTKGDDLDISGATNLIIGGIKFSGGDEPSSARVVFHSKIYDESGEKVYAMKGMLKDGLLLKTDHYFYCPLFNIWWINVWWFMGEGKFKSSDTDFDVFFRNLPFKITMPNTEGKYVSAEILMFLSPTAEYYEVDPEDPLNPDTIPWDEQPKIWEQRWALAAVMWDVAPQLGIGKLPVGPVSYLTKYIEI
jgi:hypothetical protein